MEETGKKSAGESESLYVGLSALSSGASYLIATSLSSIIVYITSEMQSIGRAKHTALMVTPWPLTIKFVQIVFIGIK